MPALVATIVTLTASWNGIIGPGGLTSRVKGLPVAGRGDAVAGPLCVAGLITMTAAVLYCPNVNVIV
jgi:hypothetical protein